MTSNTDLAVTVEARATIEEVYLYTLDKWVERQADAYELVLHNAFRRIQAFPDLGRALSSSDPAIRELALPYHTVIYRHDPGTVTILRIINPRRLRR